MIRRTTPGDEELRQAKLAWARSARLVSDLLAEQAEDGAGDSPAHQSLRQRYWPPHRGAHVKDGSVG
jgi:hypothetical protein